jgi:hypothetical protein
MYVDEEALIVAWLPTAVTPSPRVGIRTPADTSSTYSWVANGFVRVQRVGGPGRFGIDQPRISVEIFHKDYPSTKVLAAKVRAAFETKLIGFRSPDGVVLEVRTDSAPVWAPYDDVNVQRFVASFSLVTHGA